MLVYVGSFSYTPLAVLCGEFLLYAPCCFIGEFLLHSLCSLMVSFSYTPLAVLCGEFLFYAPCCFMWGVSLTRPLLFYLGSFSFTPLAVLCGESYSTLIKDAEKESKSVEKRDNGGKVRAVTARHPLHTQLHTTPTLLVPRWQAWTYRRVAATRAGDLASTGLLARSGH